MPAIDRLRSYRARVSASILKGSRNFARRIGPRTDSELYVEGTAFREDFCSSSKERCRDQPGKDRAERQTPWDDRRPDHGFLPRRGRRLSGSSFLIAGLILRNINRTIATTGLTDPLSPDCKEAFSDAGKQIDSFLRHSKNRFKYGL